MSDILIKGIYDGQVKRLRDLQSITEHCGEQSCGECENRELCDKYDNKTLSEIYKEAADAIEELQRNVEDWKATARRIYRQSCSAR